MCKKANRIIRGLYTDNSARGMENLLDVIIITSFLRKVADVRTAVRPDP
jgi:hypothetical protein